MPNDKTPIIKRSLLSWILAKNTGLQVVLVLAAVLAVGANVFPLEMQKRIVNEAINLKKIDLLILYGGLYLVAVVSASVMKYTINVLQTIIGQRTLAGMRKALYAHILSLPLGFYRKTQPGLVVGALTTELATAGDFIGMAIAVPATNLLMLLAFSGYLLWLNPLLAAITLSIYPVVLLLVPVLQKRVNRYNRKRVDATRQVSSTVGESVAGIHEIQANSAFSIENKRFGSLVDRLQKIRIIWNLYRFGVKALNSLFTNFSRFLVFALGGYLAINGQLELGALVAFMSAQEKLYAPWKELIQFYQAYQTAIVTYSRTMEYFDVAPEYPLQPKERSPHDLDGNLQVESLSFVVEDGVPLLSDIAFDLQHGQHMALVGFSGSGKSTLAQCLVQLYPYTDGKILLDRKELSQLTKADVAHNVGFVSQTPFIFQGSIEDNLLYAFRARAENDQIREYPEPPSLDDRILMLQQTGLFVDVLRFGLNTVLDVDAHRDMIKEIVRVRKTFRREYGQDLADVIEFYDPDKYLYSSSVAENFLFGDPLDDAFKTGRLPQNPLFNEVLVETKLEQPLLEAGVAFMNELVNFSTYRSADAEIRKQELLDPDAIDLNKKLSYKVQKRGIDNLSARDRQTILGFFLDYIPQKHHFFRLPKNLERGILEARARFKQKISATVPGSVSFCQMSDYMRRQSIMTNIFYGKLKVESAAAQEKVNTWVHSLLIREEFLEDIVAMGLQYSVGTKGDNLSGGQRQKLAIARTFLKKPALMIMDEATSGLDNESQARIQNLLETRLKGKCTVISVLHRLDIIKNYDTVAVMKTGKIKELGTYQDLMEEQGTLYKLVGGNK